MFSFTLTRWISSWPLWAILLHYWPSSSLSFRICRTIFPSWESNREQDPESGAEVSALKENDLATAHPEGSVQQVGRIKCSHEIPNEGIITSQGSGVVERLPLQLVNVDTSRTLRMPFALPKPYHFLAEDAAAHIYEINAAVIMPRKLVSAEVYLEELRYIHGDLRLANILLTSDDHLIICDFDSTVRPGEQLRTATPGFSQVSDLKTFQPFIASYDSEQLAIGSCIFDIITGTEPLQDAPDQVQRFFRDDFPPTNGMVFGEVIQNCWRKRYNSIAELDHVITADLSITFQNSLVLDDHDLDFRLKECHAFLDRNANVDNGD